MRTASAPSSIAPNRVSRLSRSAQPGLGPPPRRAPWTRADGADRRRMRRLSWAAGWWRACCATMAVEERARLTLHALTSHMAVMVERITAGTLDLAFRHADSPTFEGEAASVAVACAVWGPVSVGESRWAGVEAEPRQGTSAERASRLWDRTLRELGAESATQRSEQISTKSSMAGPEACRYCSAVRCGEAAPS